jgi:hypothetical protein
VSFNEINSTRLAGNQYLLGFNSVEAGTLHEVEHDGVQLDGVIVSRGSHSLRDERIHGAVLICEALLTPTRPLVIHDIVQRVSSARLHRQHVLEQVFTLYTNKPPSDNNTKYARECPLEQTSRVQQNLQL